MSEFNDGQPLGDDFEGWYPPKPLSFLAPMRIVRITKLQDGEDVLPHNFTLIYMEEFMREEIVNMGLYVLHLPVIAVQGQAVMIHQSYYETEVDRFLIDYRKKGRKLK